jgi:predicted enzyme related to lactoylglutathione lyase
MIIGIHALLYSRKPETVRAFFRDVLQFPNVDAGEGWLIFSLPPAELGIHPTHKPAGPELYLMCDDVDATVTELRAKGIMVTKPVVDAGFGRLTGLRLPDGTELGLYEAKHPTALDLPKPKATKSKTTRPKAKAKRAARRR